MRQEISELKTIISELKGTGKRTQEGDDNAGSGGRQTPSPAQSEADKARLAKVEYDDPKHPFHGKTLGEIYKMNPREAFAIDPYLATQIQNDESYKASQEQTRQQEAVAQAEREEKEFAEEYAKLTFNDRPYDQLKPEEQAQVEAMIDKVEDWMIANHKFGITVQEAYIIMDHKNLLAKTSSNASRKVIDAATRGGVRTVSSKSDGGGNNAGGDMSKWTDDQMMKHIDGLDTDAKFNDFMAKAPDSVRKAFPSLPWTPKA